MPDRNQVYFFNVTVILMLSIAAHSAASQADNLTGQIDKAVAMNRGGEWEEALSITTGLLERHDLDAVDECSLLVSAVHSSLMLGRHEDARDMLARLQLRREELDPTHWVHSECDRLHKSLRGGGESDQVQAGETRSVESGNPAHRAPGLVWSVRLANSRGEYLQAIRLAEEVRTIPGIVSEVACDNLLHAFYAYHKLGLEGDRDNVLRDFLSQIEGLDSGSTLVSEMRDLLNTIGLPVPGELAGPVSSTFEPKPDDFWQRIDPVSIGINVRALADHEELARLSGADGVLVVYRGRIISEWYSDRYDEPMGTMSSVKSIAALLAGLLIADGKIDSLADPVSKYLPGWEEGLCGEVTLKHLLSMTSGLPEFRQGGRGVGFAPDKNAFVIGLTPDTTPGLEWRYSNEGTQLLSPILEAAAGVPLHEYAQKRLFEPIGMSGTSLKVIDGQTITYADANTTLRDFARLGILMLNSGRWEGVQVIPSDWVQACIIPGDVNPDYGYLWWLETSPGSFSMRGYLNTSVYVFPDHDLVLARMQRKVYLHAMQPYKVDEAAGLLFRAVHGAKDVPVPKP